jgi:hypothetical protein
MKTKQIMSAPLSEGKRMYLKKVAELIRTDWADVKEPIENMYRLTYNISTILIFFYPKSRC